MISTLKPYLAMKDPGLPWLGRLPGHWAVQRLRNAVDMRVSNVDKHSKEGELPVRLCNYTDVYKHDRIRDDMQFMRATASPDEISRFRLERGDVLITKDSETWNDIGVPALVEAPADDLICGYHLALLRPRPDRLSGGYLFRALQSTVLAYQFHVEANGVTRYGLSHAAIKSIWLPIPPLSEQRAIVRFLDHADRRIRRYIRAKQKLIKLLEEQKQAIINEAVTRGLDPKVRLKPSGVEWLGEVPEHWNILRLRNATDTRVSNVDKNTKDGEVAVRLCNYVDVYKHERIRPAMSFMNATASHSEVKRFHLEPADVLITKDSETWNDIGVPAFVEESAADLICGYHLALLRPLANRMAGAYLFRALQSKGVARQFHVEANGVTRFGLSHAAIKSIWLPVPPIDEQIGIARYLDGAATGLATTMAAAVREIALLREYRTRLIADVVTGKLDVREAAASLPDEVEEVELASEADALAEVEEDMPGDLDAIPEEAEV